MAERNQGKPSNEIVSTNLRGIDDQALTGGHVFVVSGDITGVQCDGWLLPTDGGLNLTESFRAVVPEAVVRSLRSAGGFSKSRTLLMPEAAPPASERAAPTSIAAAPRVWLTEIGVINGDADWYMDGVEAFVVAAAEHHGRLRAASGRRPVLALPVVGTGHGGKRNNKGDIYKVLIPTLERCAAEHHVDLLLVTQGKGAYAAAQRVRRNLIESRGGLDASRRTTWDLGDDGYALDLVHATADKLATEARRGNLTLFVGAGVSQAAGLPGWTDLLAQLASSLDDGSDLALRLERLDARDQAGVLRDRFRRAEKDLHGALSAVLSGARPSLSHQLLASLPVTELVTTNFDVLLEEAVEAVDGVPVAVLPGAQVDRGIRWLLKLHGTLDDPTSIVFTRDDYLRTPVTHGALLGLVQALLLTRHMLFVGYSLQDEDFHQLVHEIRTALPARHQMGTALLLERDDLLDDLWQEDLALVAVGQTSPAQPSGGTSSGTDRGRAIQILLDLVGFLAADLTHFVLDDTYEGLLTEPEKELKGHLKELVKLLDSADEAVTTPLLATLERYGYSKR